MIMMHQLKPIGQAGIKALVKERIENPLKYVNTPLILWRADIRDAAHENVLRDVFNEYNEGKTGLNREWYRIVSVREMPHSKYGILYDMLFNAHVDKNNNKPYQESVRVNRRNYAKEDLHRNGLFVIDPVLASLDYGRNPESLKKYHSIIKNRTWGNIELAPDIPVVAYMCITEPWFEVPAIYSAAEQYIFVQE